MQAILQREFNKPFIEILEKYAPIATPIAPAAVAIGGMYSGLYAQYGGWAALPAGISGIGMEGTGYMAAHLLIKAIRRKDWGMAGAGLLFLIGYAIFAIVAMSVVPNATMFQAFVAMSIITYLTVGALAYDRTPAEEEIEKKRREIEFERQRIELARLKAEADAIQKAEDARLRELEIKLEHERTLQANAQARAAKANGRSSVREIKDEHPNRGRQLDPARLATVKAYLGDNPGASVRDVCDACGISSTDVASRYMKAAQ